MDGAGGAASNVIYNFNTCPAPPPCTVKAYYTFENSSMISGSLFIGPNSNYSIQPLYTGTKFGYVTSNTTLQTSAFALPSDGLVISFWSRTADNQYNTETVSVFLKGTNGSLFLGNVTSPRIWTRFEYGVSAAGLTIGSNVSLAISYYGGKIVALDELIIVNGNKLCFTGNCYLKFNIMIFY